MEKRNASIIGVKMVGHKFITRCSRKGPLNSWKSGIVRHNNKQRHCIKTQAVSQYCHMAKLYHACNPDITGQIKL